MSLSSRKHVRVSHPFGSSHIRILPPPPPFHHQLLLPLSSTHSQTRSIRLRCLRTDKPKCGSRDRITTATLCPFTLRTTSSDTWTPIWTAPHPLRQRHRVQHLLQLSPHTAFHHHRNPLHLLYFRHSHHYQNFHSRINRPTNLPPPSCGLRAARLLQRLPIC